MVDHPMPSWDILNRRTILSRAPWLSVWNEEVRLPNGKTIPDWSFLEMPEYAVVVALTSAGQVITTRSYKHGARQVCLGLPAGYIDPGEEPLLAIQRELLEETGYVADEWIFLGRFTADANRGCGVGHFYLAREARRVQGADSGDVEDIVVDVLDFSDLIQRVRDDEVAVLCMGTAVGLAVVALQEGWR